MLCRSVQVWFPRVSTSGGQSWGREEVVEGAVERAEESLAADEDEEASGEVEDVFIMASQLAEEVQVRQLRVR